jgi:hypothetical protein
VTRYRIQSRPECGEPFFEAPEVEEIQRALEALDRANDRLATAV